MDKKEKLLVILLISIGFFLRIWRLRELMGFDYDQEVAAFAVKQILSGKLTLIGQQTSVGGVFIGPGYYYLLAFFYWIFAMDPIGIGVMVALISIATMAFLFVLTKNIFGKETALISLVLYATNSKINFFDRTTAPSNPVMLITLITLFLLWQIRKGKTWLTPLVIAATAAASIHLHPSAAVLLPLIIIVWIFWKIPRPSRASITKSALVGFVIISPLLLFDLRHEFLNTKGIINALKKPGDQAYFFLFKLLITLRIQVENLASLFAFKQSFSAVLALATFVVWKISKISQKHLFWFWILVPAVIFSFYQKHIPDYYFLVAIPAMLIILASSLRIIAIKWSKKAFWLLFSLIVLANLNSLDNSVNPYSLKYKQQAVNLIKESKGSQAIVSFDTDLGLDAGFRFLLGQANVDFDSEEVPTHTIVIPSIRRTAPGREHTFGGIKVIESQEVSKRVF